MVTAFIMDGDEDKKGEWWCSFTSLLHFTADYEGQDQTQTHAIFFIFLIFQSFPLFLIFKLYDDDTM